MKILLTHFDPFGGATANASAEAIALLPDKIDDIQLVKAELPTVYEKSVIMMEELIKILKPDAIIMTGQAEGRIELSIERIAINFDDAGSADNSAETRIEHTAVTGAPAAYFSTLPIKEMAAVAKGAGVPAGISNSAGTFVCNHIMFCTLHMLEEQGNKAKAGFIHIPATPSQAASKRIASMDSWTAAKGLAEMIKVIK